jgi:hypothetical protein
LNDVTGTDDNSMTFVPANCGQVCGPDDDSGAKCLIGQSRRSTARFLGGAAVWFGVRPEEAGSTRAAKLAAF